MNSILVLQHVPHEHPGLLAKMASEQNIELDVVELWKPHGMLDVEDYAALIIMGGPMGVYEEYAAKNEEINLIKQALEDKMPMMGFCLGAQLLAHALGAKVYPNTQDGKRVKEIGYYDVELTGRGKQDPLFRNFNSPMNVLQWHGDTFDLPAGTSLLATAPLCSNQAFRAGDNAYGLQFHVEFTPEMIAKQIEADEEWVHTDFDLDEKAVLREAQEKAALMEEQTRKLFWNFVELIRGS